MEKSQINKLKELQKEVAEMAEKETAKTNKKYDQLFKNFQIKYNGETQNSQN